MKNIGEEISFRYSSFFVADSNTAVNLDLIYLSEPKSELVKMTRFSVLLKIKWLKWAQRKRQIREKEEKVLFGKIAVIANINRVKKRIM